MSNFPALSILLPYLLLFAAIAAVWMPGLHIARPININRLSFADVLAVLAVVSALLAGLIMPVAVVALLGLALLLFFCRKGSLKLYVRLCCGVLAMVLALALAMHKIPGFQNLLLLDKVRFSSDAQALSLYANFDKGMVGFLLLSLFCQRATSNKEFFADGKRIAVAAGLSIVALIALGLTMGFFHLDPKLPQTTLLFLSVNLFLTCVAEESFFRGFVQEALYQVSAKPLVACLAVLASAVLFGAAHLGGGVLYPRFPIRV